MKLRHLLAAGFVLLLVPFDARAQVAGVTALRDSLAAIVDVPLLFRLERSTVLPGAARTVEPLLRRGVIALRVWELTGDRADADRARDVFEAAVQRFGDDPLSHYGVALALAYGPDVRLPSPGGVLDAVTVGQSVAEILKRDPKSRARRALRRALELQPGLAEAAVLLGDLAVADGGRSRELIREAREALAAVDAAGGATPASRRALADMDIALGNYAAASAGASADDAASLRTRAVALLLQPGGQAAGAAAYWRGVERLDAAAAGQYYADVEVLVSPAEAAEWRAADLNGRRVWLERFWERRAAAGGISTAERLAEHYRRLSVARSRYVRNSTRGLDGAGILLAEPGAERHPFDDRGVLLIRHGDPLAVVSTTARALQQNETWVYDIPGQGRQLFHLVALRGSQGFSLVGNIFEALNAVQTDPIDRQRSILQLMSDVAPYDGRYQAAVARLVRILNENPGARVNDTEIRSAVERVEADYRRGARAALRTDSHVRRFSGDIAFHADVFSFRSPEARTELTAGLAIPARSLTIAATDTGVEYVLRLSVIVVDTLLAVVTRSDTLRRFARARAIDSDDFLRTHLTLPVLPSEHTTYRIVVEDVASGRGRIEPGSAVVRDYLRPGPLVSDVVLAHHDSAGDWRRGGRSFALALPRRFAAERPFEVYYELYNLTAEQPYLTRITVERADGGGFGSRVRGLFGGGRTLIDVRFDGVAAPDDEGVVRETRRLASDLPAGSYRIAIAITTRDGRSISTASLFTVDG
ncbi:MAG TPA: hypothetical protein VMN60_09750 [Longimicrobiales bacterium]|nr:hypothetical protein [Longimicrobiales bacterium]